MTKKMILASHGKMAEGVVNSMEMVVGNVDDLLCFSLMPGHDPGEITQEVESMVKAEPQVQFVILTDIRGGSVSNSITRLACYENVKLINGMNLALVIGIYLTDGVLSDDDIEGIVADAREGMAMVKYPESPENTEDDEII